MKSERAEVPVDELLAMKAPYNPRTIEPHAMERLRASIRELRCGAPVTLNRRSPAKGWPAGSTPVIVGGHQRVEAARLEGWKTFPVFWGDWTDAEEIELNIAMNNPNLQGRFDDELLKGAFALATAAGGDLDLTGFDAGERAVVVDGWASDIGSVERVAPHTDGLLATIVVECPTPDKDRVRTALFDALKALGVEGARVR